MKILHIGFILTAPLIVSGCGSGRLTQKADMSASMQGTLDQTPIAEKYWKLVTLEGKKVIMAPNQEREIYFMLKTDQHRVGGVAPAIIRSTVPTSWKKASEFGFRRWQYTGYFFELTS